MQRLSGWDAVLLYSEAPNVHMHTLKVAVIELESGRRGWGIDEFRRVIHSRLYKLAPFRYQLVDIPWKFHHPMWRENCNLDLTYHIRPWRLAAPGGRRQLDEAIGEIASTPLDRSRPLWEMYFIEGLTGNRVAVVGKVHHALADGLASANLMARGMDLGSESETGVNSYATDPAPSGGELVRAAMRDHLRQLGKVPATMKYTAEGVGRVRRSTRQLSPKLTRPFVAPPSFMNHKLTPGRRFATATLALAEVKQASKQLGVTINDLVLATSAGALRTLLIRYDGTADSPLLASMPMSFDMSPDRISGNRFSGVLVALPVDVADTADRVQQAREAAMTAKESHQLIGPEVVNRWSNYLPPAPVGSMFRWLAGRDEPNKMFNVNISNVAGPRERGRVGGALVTELYSVGPLTAGAGVNITVWSYVDQFNISVLTDTATIDDPHEITDALVAEFIEIRRAAGCSETTTIVESAIEPA